MARGRRSGVMGVCLPCMTRGVNGLRRELPVGRAQRCLADVVRVRSAAHDQFRAAGHAATGHGGGTVRRRVAPAHAPRRGARVA